MQHSCKKHAIVIVIFCLPLTRMETCPQKTTKPALSLYRVSVPPVARLPRLTCSVSNVGRSVLPRKQDYQWSKPCGSAATVRQRSCKPRLNLPLNFKHLKPVGRLQQSLVL